MRLRELAVKQKTASGNQLKALLLEFNIRVSARKGGLGGVIESVLENAENEFSAAFTSLFRIRVKSSNLSSILFSKSYLKQFLWRWRGIKSCMSNGFDEAFAVGY